MFNSLLPDAVDDTGHILGPASSIEMEALLEVIAHFPGGMLGYAVAQEKAVCLALGEQFDAFLTRTVKAAASLIVARQRHVTVVTPEMSKAVSYCYATSGDAKALGFEASGCWSLDLSFGCTAKPKLAVLGFATREEARLVAELLPFEWDRYTF